MTVNSRTAYLGIAHYEDIKHLCRHLSEFDVVGLYKAPVVEAAAVLGVNREYAADIGNRLRSLDFDRILVNLKRLGIEYITKADSKYPALLLNIFDPPPCLFVKGALFADEISVAVVGTRRCTAYGLSIAKDIAAGLAAAGLTIVSGMARGIDSAAHYGALEKGDTIAVLGCGLDIVYPPENKTLAARIENRGALVSEYPPGTPPRPKNFPARNRIISGLAAAVVVVEAAKKSGALITADFALEQGREVLVVPGSVRSPMSAGCHQLIKQGAGLAGSAEDILEALEIIPGVRFEEEPDLSVNEESLLSAIEYEKTHVDEILAGLEMPADQVLSGLSLLEVRGYIARQAGGWFYRLK